MKKCGYITYDDGQWRGFLASEEWLPQGGVEAIATLGEVYSDRGDRLIRRLTLGNHIVFAKFLWKTHTTLLRRIRTAWRHLWGQDRVYRVWRVHRQLLAAGLGCAEPLMALVKRDGSQLFVASEVTEPTLQDTFLQHLPVEQERALLRLAGQRIAEMHQKGFIHGDCFQGNLAISAEGQLILMDNDRTVKHAPWGFDAARRKNLIQFCSHRNVTSFLQKDANDLFLDAYLESYYPNNPAASAREKRTLLPKIAARIPVVMKESCVKWK